MSRLISVTVTGCSGTTEIKDFQTGAVTSAEIECVEVNATEEDCSLIIGERGDTHAELHMSRQHLIELRQAIDAALGVFTPDKRVLIKPEQPVPENVTLEELMHRCKTMMHQRKLKVNTPEGKEAVEAFWLGSIAVEHPQVLYVVSALLAGNHKYLC
jgi:hypothetical protein